MALGGLAAVLYPFTRPRERDESEETRLRLRELVAAKETLYATLKELDFDRVAGKLSEEDFRQLEARYRARAIEVLKAIDALKGEARGEDEELAEALEREILGLRRKLQATPPPTPREPAPEPRFCPHCGGPVSSLDNFCSRCGAPLRRASK
jgi:hypothetical protein